MSNNNEMKCEISSKGQPNWIGVTTDSPFDASLFYNVEMSYSSDREYQIAFHSNLGSLTVLHRMTGFGYMDTESGYRDMDGKFWLATGMVNVAMSGVKTVGEAIEFVKKNANTCIGC